MTSISNNSNTHLDTDIDTNTNATSINTNQKRSSLRNKIVGVICGATLMMGAFSFMPAMDTGNTHTSTSTGSSTTVSSSVAKVAPVSSSYQGIARQAAINNGINPDLFVRQIQQESGFNPNATSYVGAQGIAQFMPATAAAMGVNPHDPVSALNGAARLMADLNRQFGGDYAKALAAYNAGPGNVQSAVARGGGNWLANTPAETQHYVHTILG